MKKIFHKIPVNLVLVALFTLAAGFLLYHFLPHLTPNFGLTHAKELHDDLVQSTSSQVWIFNVWKVALSLANVIVIAMLLFVAVVNILHLQYDTYAIKKALPLLIIGIIMANFSLLICRMIVDAAQVLTNTFAQDPRTLVADLLCGFGAIGASGSGVSTMALIGLLLNPVAAGGGVIIVAILVILVVMIAVLILSFLLWIRKTAIFLLVAVSPVAFIMYAFPPTQGLFKQWWGWFLKWTFMGPLVMLLVWVASKIGASNCTIAGGGAGNFSISALLAECAVLYLAAIVPFKLGGGVMTAWGNFGKKMTGTDSNGIVKKAVDANIQRKKDLAGGAIGAAWGNTRVGQWMDQGRKNEEGHIANYKNRREGQLATQENKVHNRHAEFAENERKLEEAKKQIEKTKKNQVADYLNRNDGEAAKREMTLKIDLANAEGAVSKAETDAEKAVRQGLGNKQRLRERQVEHSKTELDNQIKTMDNEINEGRLDNITDTELNEILGENPKDGSGGKWSGVDVKMHFENQQKRTSDLDEKLSKRLGQDMTKLSQEKLAKNVELRTSQKELLEAGIGVETNLDKQGKLMAGGKTRIISGVEALETAEQSRFRGDEEAAKHFEAKAAEYQTKFSDYTPVMADALDTQANTHQTTADGLKAAADTSKTNLDAQKLVVEARRAELKTKQTALGNKKNDLAKKAAEIEKSKKAIDAATDPADKTVLEAKHKVLETEHATLVAQHTALETSVTSAETDHDTAESEYLKRKTKYREDAGIHKKSLIKAENTREAARIIRQRATSTDPNMRKMRFEDYLSNNVAGRQQKNINPDFSSEVDTQRKSDSPSKLVEDALNGEYGTGENRGNGKGKDSTMSKLVRGEVCDLDEAETKATIVQFDAIWENAQTARQGDQAGLDSLDGINQIMIAAERADFPAAASASVMEDMPIDASNQFKHEMARMKSGKTLKQWHKMSEADRDAAAEAVDLEDMVKDPKFFSKLVTEGAGEPAKTNKEFIKRYLRKVEEDPGLTLGSSYGTRATRPRPVNKNSFIENQGKI